MADQAFVRPKPSDSFFVRLVVSVLLARLVIHGLRLAIRRCCTLNFP